MTDITIPTDSWVSVNSLASVTVGAAFNIQNKGTTGLLLQETSSQPTIDSLDGTPLNILRYDYAEADVTSGSLEIWAKSKGSTGNIVTIKTL